VTVDTAQGRMTKPCDGTDSESMSGTRSGTVDVWWARLVLPPSQLSRLSGCLDEAEQERAGRFHFQRDRARFVASRAVLRHILAGYLGTAPGEIRFGYGLQGKPFLLDRRDLHFNVSHAEDVLVAGVAQGRELGVDVERMFSETVMAEVSGRVLSRPERELFEGLDAGERREWFVRLWTRKEAYIKADGRGMSLPLDRIDVSTFPNRVRLLTDGLDDWPLCPRWTVRNLEAAPGYTAALVSEGLDWQVACFEWPGGPR
jgi:4'-phosphopantetheinyl transferase